MATSTLTQYLASIQQMKVLRAENGRLSKEVWNSYAAVIDAHFTAIFPLFEKHGCEGEYHERFSDGSTCRGRTLISVEQTPRSLVFWSRDEYGNEECTDYSFELPQKYTFDPEKALKDDVAWYTRVFTRLERMRLRASTRLQHEQAQVTEQAERAELNRLLAIYGLPGQQGPM